jgi:hypothetical protein
MCSPGGDPFLGRVSPFGYRRLGACTRLPDAFRSVPRPSSALVTQASPVRLLLLDLSCAEPVGLRVSFDALAIQFLRYMRCASSRIASGPESTRTTDLPLIRGML